MVVVVAEKPSVARDLATIMESTVEAKNGYLQGRDRVYTWALGHLGELSPPEHYVPELAHRWDLAILPVIPERYTVQAIPAKRNQLNVLGKLLANATDVIVATDAGREGELIWQYIQELTGYRGTWRRLWLSETTPAAVKAGFDGLLAGDAKANLARAARLRAEADWLVGMNVTMALSARHGGLWTAGRVQTPVLAWVVDRERVIVSYNPTDYWLLIADFGAWRATWYSDQQDRFLERQVAEAVAARCRGQQAHVETVESREAPENPPRILDLTTLQREANQRYHFSAARTLDAAQRLYERGYITYPRTEARYITETLFAGLPERLRPFRGHPAYPPTPLSAARKRVVGPVTDHHAILPTGKPLSGSAADTESRVYALIVARTLQALDSPARWMERRVRLRIGGEVYQARGRWLVEPGWRRSEQPETTDAVLPDLAPGQVLPAAQIRIEAKRTEAPRRYTEASLLALMAGAARTVDNEDLAEMLTDRGIGTPATRAAIIETLIARKYIHRQGRWLVPTVRGEALIRLVPPEMRSAELTAEWEARLRAIEGGQDDGGDFTGQIQAFVWSAVDWIKNQEAITMSRGESLGKCPLCGGDVYQTHYGYACEAHKSRNEGCGFIVWKEIASKRIPPEIVSQLLRDGVTAKPTTFRSKTGKEFRAKLRLDDNGKVVFAFERATVGVCPICGGDVVESLKSYRCEHNDTVLWKEISGATISPGMAAEILKQGRTSKPVKMVSKAGRPFTAYLRLAENGHVVFDFEKTEKTPRAAGEEDW